MTMTKKSKRTDVHCPSKILPANYTLVLSYSLPTSSEGVAMPAFGLNCEIDLAVRDAKTGDMIEAGKHHEGGRCCMLGLNTISKVKWAERGGLGKCTVCGARFTYGDVWVHSETQEHIHLGHICAAKHELLADRSEFEIARGRMERATMTQVQRSLNNEEREAFLDANPGLREAFKLGAEQAEILANDPKGLPFRVATLVDLKEKFTTYRKLSEKQVAFALKLAEEIRNPKALPPTEKQVPAPEGKRLTVQGTIVSLKSYESAFGEQTRMTVKVQTPKGIWLAWGSYPKALWDVWTEGRPDQTKQAGKGDVVSFVADLKQGREPHFALFKRPTQAKLVKKGEVK
jgi:hypothetical protein